jgi:thioester reductase-like protein
MKNIFITGFPGLLASSFLKALFRSRSEEMTVFALVEKRFLSRAKERVKSWEENHTIPLESVKLLKGDITLESLFSESDETHFSKLENEIHEIYHFAAIYDLSVSKSLSDKVNRMGTIHLIKFAESCKNLHRFHYVSTCYVSGRYEGFFTESDLDVGQKFNNHYEKGKYLAEKAVQDAADGGLPTSIYRPGIVVGDQKTGETEKFDGPYFIIQLLLRQSSFAFLPRIGRPDKVELNIVPRDFVIDAITALSSLKEEETKTVYQLCDPHPVSVQVFLDLLEKLLQKRILQIPASRYVTRTLVKKTPGLESILKLPAESIDYFSHPTLYRCERTSTTLEKFNIKCPRVPLYIENLVSFTKKSTED